MLGFIRPTTAVGYFMMLIAFMPVQHGARALLQVKWGAKVLPQRSLKTPFGEDSYRISDDGVRAVVADGVGGFRFAHGVSSAHFARGLAAELAQGESDILSDTSSALQTLASRSVAGAATLACIDIHEFKGSTLLEVAVIGDCEVAVFRPTAFVGAGSFASGMSTAQRRRNNNNDKSAAAASSTPQSPSPPPPPQSPQRSQTTDVTCVDGVRWLPVYKSGRGMAGSNTPHQMSVTTKGIVASNFRRELRRATINLQPRDVILMGSDGLFGNLHEAEILNHVTLAATGGRSNASRLAQNLAKAARQNFYKPDDITAVAGLIA
jgi:serine/threonine protein phosphatase PrpC